MADQLVYDVLEKIFSYLDAKDLAVCESVCCQWRYVIEQRPLWRKLLERKFESSQYWRKSWDEMNFDADQVKEFCLTIAAKLEVDRNWLSGSFRLSIFKNFEPEMWHTVFHMSDDYILYQPVFPSPDFRLLNRHTAVVKSIFIDPCWLCCAAINQNILICGGQKMVKIFDAKTARKVNQLMDPNGWEVRSLAFDSRDLLITGSSDSKECQLTMWRMKSPHDIAYIRHWKFEGNSIKLVMDNRFIAVIITKYLVDKSFPWRQLGANEVFFLSTSKLSFVRSHSTYDSIEYHQGIVSLLCQGRYVQIADVSTGRFHQHLKLQYWSKSCFLLKMRSNFLVTVEYRDRGSLFHIYDIKMSRETIGDLNSALLKSFWVPLIMVRRLECNETRLSCIGTDTETGEDIVATLDFE